MSEEDLEDDFEQTEYRHAADPQQSMHSPQMTLSPLPELDSLDLTTKSHPSRSGSMATVKLQRRARLAEKLREVFDVPGIQEVIAGKVSATVRLMLPLTGHRRRDAVLVAQVYP